MPFNWRKRLGVEPGVMCIQGRYILPLGHSLSHLWSGAQSSQEYEKQNKIVRLERPPLPLTASNVLALSKKAAISTIALH